MVKFLRHLGYVVNSPDQKQNIVLNTIDILLIFLYIILSFFNVLFSKPSIMLLVINGLIMARFIVNNLIEERRLTRLPERIGLKGIVLVYYIKIIIECVIIILLSVFAIWAFTTTKSLSVVKLFVGIVLIITFLENGLSFLERLYDAEPNIISN